jgi:hypothetical protein
MQDARDACTPIGTALFEPFYIDWNFGINKTDTLNWLK